MSIHDNGPNLYGLYAVDDGGGGGDDDEKE
jgi:hypothetical protein